MSAVQPPQPPQQGEGQEEGASGGSTPVPSSPGALLTRLQTRFQQSAEDLLMTQEQNTELEKRIKTLTEHILTANEEKETLKTEHRAAISRLEEAALAERRRYENALCSARQQQQRCQMDLQLTTEELAALRGQVKTLQMDKVSLARQVRDLESEVKARCRLQQSASDQMVRHNQAKNKLNKEVSGLVEWLKRLEAECSAAAELNRRLQLQLQHQSLRLEQLSSPASTTAGTVTPCPELEQLRMLLAAGNNQTGAAGDDPKSPPAAGGGPASPSGSSVETEVRPTAPPLSPCHSDTFSDGRKAAVDGDEAVLPNVDWSDDSSLATELTNPLLLTVPQISRGTSV